MASRRYISDQPGDLLDFASSDEDNTPATPHATRTLIRIGHERPVVSPKHRMIDRETVMSFLSPSTTTRHTPSSLHSPSTSKVTVTPHSTPKTCKDRPQTISNVTISTPSPSTKGRRQEISNIYKLMDAQFLLSEIFTSEHNQKVAALFKDKLMSALGIDAKQAKKMALGKFRCVKILSKRSDDTKVDLRVKGRKYAKLRRRLLRLPLIMKPNEISDLQLTAFIMSSDDDDGVTHVPSWRSERYTHILTEADKLEIPNGHKFIRCEGSVSKRPMDESLADHPGVRKDTIIVAIGNCCTSIFAGFVIYSYIGNLAHTMKVGVEDVSQDGAGLAFVIYPMAVLNLPGSPFWAFLFFFMLITLGLDTQFTLIETVSTTIFDSYPHLIAKKTYVILGLCVGFFVPGLMYVTQGGNYILKMVDSYASGWNVIIICITETLVISYVYKYERFAKDVQVMIGRKPPLFWKICIMGLSQAIITFVLIFDWANFKTLKYGPYEYPLWANALGWFISVYVVAAIPIVAVINVRRARGTTFIEKLKNCAKPSYDWGPALPRHRMYVDYVPDWQIHPIGDRNSLGSEVIAAADLRIRQSTKVQKIHPVPSPSIGDDHQD